MVAASAMAPGDLLLDAPHRPGLCRGEARQVGPLVRIVDREQRARCAEVQLPRAHEREYLGLELQQADGVGEIGAAGAEDGRGALLSEQPSQPAIEARLDDRAEQPTHARSPSGARRWYDGARARRDCRRRRSARGRARTPSDSTW